MVTLDRFPQAHVAQWHKLVDPFIFESFAPSLHSSKCPTVFRIFYSMFHHRLESLHIDGIYVGNIS
jgi:hypothetical protein